MVSELKVEGTNLANPLAQVDAALTAFGKMNGRTSYTRPGRTLSASARNRIRLAQKQRWAKARSGAGSLPAAVKTTSSVKPMRKISAAGKRRIAAAQRARWGKVKPKKAA
jgi:hypothetical protein